MSGPAVPLEPRMFRDILGLFATGIAVIVTQRDGEVHAMTANAVTSLSLDPMLMLFCPGKKSKMAAHLHEMTHFSINFLRTEQQALSTYFAGGWKEPAPPPFRFVPCTEGAPRLEGSLAALGCEKHELIEAGDHWIVIGRVVALHKGIEPHRPLLFFRGNYRYVDFSEGGPAPDIGAGDEPPHIFYDRWHL
jgi:flavin reductase (DIM6/NTAB) family NADH-FMN oxidoreductase RutF